MRAMCLVFWGGRNAKHPAFYYKVRFQAAQGALLKGPMWKHLQDRQTGSEKPQVTAARIAKSRLLALDLSTSKEISSGHRSGVTSLQVDNTEQRYLLSGASDGSLAVHDTQVPTKYEQDGTAVHERLFKIDKRTEGAHQYAVSSVSWYPIDTGLFVSGSFDDTVKCWDTNTLQVEMTFSLPAKVFAVAMSPVAVTHTLIAVGSGDTRVRLCDVSSGGFAHSLAGHRDAVWAVTWSLSSEFVLMTGGCDGAIRFWDIRRAGCFKVLDQHKTQMGRRPPPRPQDTRTDPPNALQQREGRGPKRRGAPDRPQLLHPGMASALDRTSAHDAPVTSLQGTPDGQYLFSTGADSRLRLWDIETGNNTLVNYRTTRGKANRGTQIAVSPDSSHVYQPSGSVIQAFDVWSGEPHATLRGHFEGVNCCTFQAHDQEMYSGGNDRQILVWEPPAPAKVLEDEHADQDNWSDDEGKLDYGFP
ncbi:putative WD-40 repeat family protein [Klebsormidium nitens]|uniref:Putative WD-40 repeat family protein n=1 Tax=Klebsormidium nitens TaxID=105231 RepID=A0A1Y1IA25_KLENI|nr:putative WD-40 repeat family protein [Klebsormidium nitens]|eukprot:GAQ85546.1 putative WD-40 repeat family protein [Klebsormidium nitens]